MVLTCGISPESRGGVHLFIFKPPYDIGSEVPSLLGHSTAYRWRSLPRVRRHRASKPQDSSERVLPWQITMDQLICAFLSHNYWYEVGMLNRATRLSNKHLWEQRHAQQRSRAFYKKLLSIVEPVIKSSGFSTGLILATTRSRWFIRGGFESRLGNFLYVGEKSHKPRQRGGRWK